jgi:hypothetical protein
MPLYVACGVLQLGIGREWPHPPLQIGDAHVTDGLLRAVGVRANAGPKPPRRRCGPRSADAGQSRCRCAPLQWSVKRRGCVCDARARRQAARFVHTHACILLHAGDRAVLKFGGAAELLRTFNVSADALVERFVA